MAARRRVLKAGIAASNDRRLTVACTVRDVSATGARLRVDCSLNIPDTFELIIAVDGLEADCQVVWRKANEVGVRFLAAPRMVAAKREQVINPLVPRRRQPCGVAPAAAEPIPLVRLRVTPFGMQDARSWSCLLTTKFVPETFIR